MTVRRNNSKRDPNLRFNMYPDDDQHFVNVITAGSTIIATPTTRLRKIVGRTQYPTIKGIVLINKPARSLQLSTP